MIAVGIDPGTKSFDLCVMNEENILFEEKLPSQVIANEPYKLVEKLLSLNADIIIAPSGYGLSLKKFSEIDERDKFLITLTRKGEFIPVIEGMHRVYELLKGKVEMVFIPGVILLPTIPRYRKFNKIDMGTADKLAVYVLAVELHCQTENIEYNKACFSVIEAGYGYNAAAAIYQGKIVDGIGGTNFPGPAFLNSGAMDGELAYLLGKFEKSLLFEGGASFLAKGKAMEPEEFTMEKYPEEFNAFAEGILRAAIIEAEFSKSKLIYLSGRLMDYDNFYLPIRDMLLKSGFEVKKLNKLSPNSKAAAQGAAIIGLGLLGTKYTPLIEHMEINKAQGSVLDYVYWKDKLP